MIYLGHLSLGCEDSFLLLAGEFPDHATARETYTHQLAHLFQMAGAVFGIRLDNQQTAAEVNRAKEEILDRMACPGCGKRRMTIRVETTVYPTIEALLEDVPSAIALPPGQATWTTKPFRRAPLEKTASN